MLIKTSTVSPLAMVNRPKTTTPRRSRMQLVCTECHRLKVKCDRRSPCAGCIKRGKAEHCKAASTDAWLSMPQATLPPVTRTLEQNIPVSHTPSQSGRPAPAFAPAPLPSPQSSPSEHRSEYTSPRESHPTPALSTYSAPTPPSVHNWSERIPALLNSLQQHCKQSQFLAIKEFLGSDTHEKVIQTCFERSLWMYSVKKRRHFVDLLCAPWVDRGLVGLYSLTAVLLGIHANVRFLLPQYCRKHVFTGKTAEEIKEKAQVAVSLVMECVSQAKQVGSLPIEAFHAMLLVGGCRKESGDLNGYREMLAKVIHEAQMLGYHMEPDPNTMSIEEIEWRRNLWWTVFSYDRFAALNLGVPYLVGHHGDIKLPVLLLDGSIMPASGLDPYSPEGQRANSCTMVHTILMAQLARISGRIYDQTHVKDFSPADALLIDKELQIFEQSLPPAYKFGREAASVEETNGDESIQRYILFMTIFQIRVYLFRDLHERLMRAGPELHQRALQACRLSNVHSAMSLIQVYKDSLEDLSEDCFQWIIFIKPIWNAIGILLDAFLDDIPSSPCSHSWFYYKIAVQGQSLLEKVSNPGTRAREALIDLDDRIQRAAKAIGSS